MAICVVLIAIYWLPNLNFSDLSLFGIKPEEGGHDARRLVLGSLWLLWGYHAALFVYYAQRDWKDWRTELRREGGAAFPEIPMYFGRRPSEDATRARVRDVETWSWSFSKSRTNAEWTSEYKSKDESPARGVLFAIPVQAFHSVRSRVAWGFAFVDCGIPLLLSLVAVASASFTHSI
jgi:hypothetical protein